MVVADPQAAGVERGLPRLVSEPLRTLIRQNMFDGAATTAGSKLFRRGSGVPKRTSQVLAIGPVGEPLAARPKAVYQRAATEVLWTGDGIAVTDQRGRVTRWRTTTEGVVSDFLPAVLKSPRRVPLAPPTGDAAVAGMVVARTKTQPVEILVLIDRRSRRVGSVSVLFQRIAGVQREWGPLSPVQKFLHFWLAMFTDLLQAPPTSRRAMREAAKRPL